MCPSSQRHSEIRIYHREPCGSSRKSLFYREVHTLFEELIHRPWGGQEWKPCADIVETDAEYTIIMDLPGVDAENLKVVAGDGQVLIEGIRDIEHGAEQDDLILSERPSGGFARVFEFEAPVDTSDITTEQENGVVKIIVRKKK